MALVNDSVHDINNSLIMNENSQNLVIDTCNLKAIAGSDRQCDTFEREDSYIHPILSQVHVSKLIGESIDCVVCRKPRNREKYKRHLLFHVKNKELSEDSVNDILFECRSIRKDTKPQNVNKPRIGYKCFLLPSLTNNAVTLSWILNVIY